MHLSLLSAVIAISFTAACVESASAPHLEDNPDVALASDDDGTLRATATADGATVAVRSLAFESWDELYDFAIEHLGAERTLDDDGNTIGVHGTSLVAGDVTYVDEDAAATFRDGDLVRALLGGADGVVHVAGEPYTIGPDHGGTTGTLTLALTDSASRCVGGDCVGGHSWVTNYVLYRSIGSTTTQTAGGMTGRNYNCCRYGDVLQPTTYGQVCKHTEWIPRDQLPLGSPPQQESWTYPVNTCTSYSMDNQLTVAVRPLSASAPPSHSATGYASKGATNTTKVELSSWAFGVRVDLGVITDVKGLCGYHWSSRGGSTAPTRAGDINDTICNGFMPTGPQY